MKALICKLVGSAGLSGVAAAFDVLYKLLTNPTDLLELFRAVAYHQNPGNIVGEFAAAVIGLTLSIVAAVVAALLHPSPLQKG